MTLKITVPVTLSKSGDGYFIEIITTQDGRKASIALANHGPLVNEIVTAWADEQVQAALLARRRKTGTKDKDGVTVIEGDIVERFDLPGYTDVYGVIKWDGDLAAFVMQGLWPDGQTWHSSNLKNVGQAKVIGNIFQNPGVLKVAKEVSIGPPAP